MTPSASRRTSRRNLLAGLSAAALLWATPFADAHPAPLVRSHSYDVALEDGSGSRLETFHHGGQVFVLGQYGNRYAIRIFNRSPRRVEAVVSVDGRDAISGRRGDYVGQRGYLIGAHDSIVVSGFRKSLDEVATFRFTSPGDSYSARMGTPENVGVIGVAFFPERAEPMDPVPIARRDESKKRRRNPNPRAAQPAPTQQGRASEGAAAAPKTSGSSRTTSARSPARAEASRSADGYAPYETERYAPQKDNLGTRYGESRESAVVEVAFERADPSRPAALVTLRYDDAQGLEARGIRVHTYPERRPWWRRDEPVAFPDSRFAPPPPSYEE